MEVHSVRLRRQTEYHFHDGIFVSRCGILDHYRTLVDFVVFRPYRGQGYGKFMMEYIMAHDPPDNIVVDPWEDISYYDLKEFYKRYGFKESSHNVLIRTSGP